MTKVKTAVSGFSAAVVDALTNYTEEVRVGLDKAAKDTAKETVRRLRAGGSYQGGENSGYNRGWTTKVTEGIGGVEVIIHNAKAPGLTHLLEKGHAKPGGGRTRAFPHIAPAEEEAVEKFKKRVEEVIRNA